MPEYGLALWNIGDVLKNHSLQQNFCTYLDSLKLQKRYLKLLYTH